MSEKEKESQEELEKETATEPEVVADAPAEVVADIEIEVESSVEGAEETPEEETPETESTEDAPAEEPAVLEVVADAPAEVVASPSGEAETPESKDEGAEIPELEADASAEAKIPEPAGEGTGTKSAEPEVPVDTGPPKKWYVVHTYSGHENKVKENITKMVKASQIQEHFGQIIVPTEEVAEMKKGKKTITTRKFFPSYILVEMHMSDEARHLVSDIPGVTSFVGTQSGPQPLSKAEVERILGRMDKEKQTIIPEIPFTLGEHIRIKDGPFSDFTGIIDEINAERGKLKVLVSIFGRDTPVELDFLQVENL